MIKISLEKILETAKRFEVPVEMTPSASPFVIKNSTQEIFLSVPDLVQIAGHYSKEEMAMVEVSEVVSVSDATIRNISPRKISTHEALFVVSDLPTVV